MQSGCSHLANCVNALALKLLTSGMITRQWICCGLQFHHRNDHWTMDHEDFLCYELINHLICSLCHHVRYLPVVSRARPFTNREGRKESGQIQYTILLCTVSNLQKEGHDYDVIIHHEFRKNLRSGFLNATWLSRNMITDWRRLFKRVGGGLETAFWSESVGNFSSATPASTWSSSLADAHPGPCSLFFFL